MFVTIIEALGNGGFLVRERFYPITTITFGRRLLPITIALVFVVMLQ
jgi:hypothetical protein